jgi:hypothetical protein
MGVTLTGKVIKDSYDGLLKLSDNTELTSSLKRVTDGFGNETAMSINNTEGSFLNLFNERTVSEITGDASGNVVATRDYVDAATGGTANSYSMTFDGDGTESVFVMYNPFPNNPVMVQVVNDDTGATVAEGAGFTVTRAYTSNPNASTVTLDFQSPIIVGVTYRIMIQKIAAMQQ